MESKADDYIETVPKRGYRFIAEIVELPEEALPRTELLTEDLAANPAPPAPR